MSLNQNPVQTTSKLTPNSQRLLLETSFGSPNKLENGIKTVQRREFPNGPRAKAKNSSKPLKSVAFSNSSNPYPPTKYKPTTLSLCETRPNPFQGNIVDLIYDDWFGLAPLASPENSSLSELSSISSRASISLNLNLSSSIEKFLNKVTSNVAPSPPRNNIFQSKDMKQQTNVLEEAQLRTPPCVMRRTPKFSENLSTCAMDWKNENSYKRMGKIFLHNPKTEGSESDDDDDNGNFGTAESLQPNRCCNNNNNSNSDFIIKDESKDWKSAESVSKEYSEINKYNNILCNPNSINSNRKYTVSDSAMVSDCKSLCPVCPCTKLPPEMCCNKITDHIKCIVLSAQECSGKYSFTNTTSSSDTYYSLTGSDCGILQQNGTRVLNLSKLGTYEEETLTCELASSYDNALNQTISSITRSGILESHFPVYFDSSDEKSSLLSHENSPSQRKTTRSVNNSNALVRKKSNDDDFSSIFSRNESLPLLNLVEKSSPTNYMKRKRIYPTIHTPPIIQQSPKIVPITKHSRSTPASISNLYIYNESNV